MRQPFPKIPVHPRPRDRTQQRNENRRIPRADLSEQRSRTGARNAPAQTEKQAAENLAFVECFDGKDDCLSL